MRNSGSRYKSEPDKGTEFTLDFWINIVPQEACYQVIEDIDISIKGVHVLLCEDNELNMEIAVYLLEDAGAVVDCAKNRLEAVEKFRDSESGCYDVILMDIRMPVMDGLEAGMNEHLSKPIDIRLLCRTILDYTLRYVP